MRCDGAHAEAFARRPASDRVSMAKVREMQAHNRHGDVGELMRASSV